jgi:hypothetical protein
MLVYTKHPQWQDPWSAQNNLPVNGLAFTPLYITGHTYSPVQWQSLYAVLYENSASTLKYIATISRTFGIHMSVHCKYISKLQPTRCNVSWFIYFYRRSTCFRWFLRPSSGAQNCTYSFWYCQPIMLLAAVKDKMELAFHLIHDSSQQQYCLTIRGAVCIVLCSWWWEEERPETCRASVEINKLRILLVVIWNYGSPY